MAGQEQIIEWRPEQIPDEDLVFMRVHELWRRDGFVSPGAFKNHGDGMSTDWEEYATPSQTRARAREPGKNAVISLIVGEVRQVPAQRVEHTPDIERRNRAHTDVFGEKDEEVRVKLRRIASIVIAFDTPVDRPRPLGGERESEKTGRYEGKPAEPRRQRASKPKKPKTKAKRKKS